MANVLDCDTAVSEFKFLSPYYVHFQTNVFWEGMKLVIPSIMGLIVPRLRFGLVEFYGISTIVGYLMPNPFLYI